MQSYYQPTFPLSVIRLNLSCSFLRTLFGNSFSQYEKNKDFQNIVLFAKEITVKVNYSVKKRDLFKKLLSVKSLQEKDRTKISSLMVNGEEFFNVELEECEEIIGEI